jgi:hypothetical protein
MFKKVINHKNLEGGDAQTVLYFHVGKAELLKLVSDDTIVKRMEAVSKSNNKADIIREMEAVIRLGLGVRSEDGSSFIKDKETQDRIIGSPAYDEMLVEFLLNENKFLEFVEQLLPEDMRKKLLDEMKTKAIVSDVVKISENEAADGRPKWEQENRKPTKGELIAMPKEEMMKAFAKHPALANEL